VVLLLGIAFLAGIVTAVSPCVLPVLPIVFAGGASGGGRRRPLAIVAGVVVAFSASLLVVTWVLRRLGLPEDLLRDLAIVLLFVVAAMLIVPQLGVLIEQPLARLTRRRGGDLGGGFLLGLSLGLVFVPCGGVIQGYIAAQSASIGDLGAKTVAITLAYALGVAVPMLAIAYGGRAASSGLSSFRAHAREIRVALGVVIAASAVLIVFHVDRTLQTKIGDYTSSLQHAEKSCFAQQKLGYRCNRETVDLADFGAAPDFQGISNWFNSQPLSIEQLRGKVVLVDFWTYSCINCLRTLPHLRSWWKDYERRGLVIVGVHTPEFAFEGKPSNVQEAVKQLGVTWPVALDPAYGTWKAYRNQYWPAEYLIDKDGHVRNAHFGEGEYQRTERLIRQLLGEPGPARAELADMTPTELLTPETYLGFERADDRYVGPRVLPNAPQAYRLPSADLAQNDWAYGGTWTIGDERAISGRAARIGLHFHARNVYIVLGGKGRVGVSLNGHRTRTLVVSGIGRLYHAVEAQGVIDAQLRLSFTPGISAYSFTFG
jgi:cytochrome c biogenesis protein CcdA/thiol-disulfide isomerase/thioredoxin